jgi:hypothetical protein
VRVRAPGPGYRVGALAAIACLGWVPFIGRALSPDEGGFLVLAAQWSPGSSLYGDYWVDRPPALVGIFAAADWLGGPWALRSIGIAAVVVAVVLAGAIGRMVAPGSPKAAALTAATAAVFVATPLFGGSVVNGELLGLPFVLVGVALAIASVRSTRPASAMAWSVAAGAAGATAFLVKQSFVDVFVFVLAVVVSQWRLAGWRLLVGTALGALATGALVLWLADLRGTGASDLWDAVITFRGEASAVIAESATTTTATRLGGLILALLGSGAVFVAGVLAWAARRPRSEPESGFDLRWPAAALLGWEAFAVLFGGSYWLHYLMGLVPGLVVLAAAAAQRGLTNRSLRAAYGFAAISALAAIGWVVVNPIDRPEEPAIAYLEDHAEPGDTGVVAFGGANILEAAGLDSPYQYLWSLPVRVRDPDLEELAEVLAGPEAPTWLVSSGPTLASWGIDDDAAADYVDARYDLAADLGRFSVYHRNDAP